MKLFDSKIVPKGYDFSTEKVDKLNSLSSAGRLLLL